MYCLSTIVLRGSSNNKFFFLQWKHWCGLVEFHCSLIILYCHLLVECWGSMIFWCRSGSVSPDPHLWLVDPTSFFIHFKDAKKIFFSYFFLITCPQAHHLPSKKITFAKILCKKFYFAGITSVHSTHLWEKRRIRIRTSDLRIRIWKAQKHGDLDSIPDPDPQHCL